MASARISYGEVHALARHLLRMWGDPEVMTGLRLPTEEEALAARAAVVANASYGRRPVTPHPFSHEVVEEALSERHRVARR